MSIETIYKTLRDCGMNHAGAIGMMGNMQAESSMKSNIAQRGMTKLSDADYTTAADNGTIDFVNDAVGYGLCQWTYKTRKAALLAWCRNRGVSVGDEQAQVLFCVHELQSDYPALWAKLCVTGDYTIASDSVCDTYERPAINNYAVRQRFAAEFDCLKNTYGVTDTNVGTAVGTVGTQKDPSVFMLQLIMSYNGYWSEDADGVKSKDFIEKLKEFVKDMEAS